MGSTRIVGAAVAATLLLGGLTACEKTRYLNDARHVTRTQTFHAPQVSSELVTRPVAMSRGEMLFDDEAGLQLNQFVSDFLSNGGGAIEVAIWQGPGGREQARADGEAIRKYLTRLGVRPDELAIRITEAQGEGPLVLSYRAYSVRLPNCDLGHESMQTFRNTAHSTFGCAVRSNLAAMVSNPADLEVVRASTPADTVRKSLVIQNYRAGKPTEAETNVGDDAAQTAEF